MHTLNAAISSQMAELAGFCSLNRRRGNWKHSYDNAYSSATIACACLCVWLCVRLWCSNVLLNHKSQPWVTNYFVDWVNIRGTYEIMKTQWGLGLTLAGIGAQLLSPRRYRVSECFPASCAESLQRKRTQFPDELCSWRHFSQTTVYSVFFPLSKETFTPELLAIAPLCPCLSSSPQWHRWFHHPNA